MELKRLNAIELATAINACRQAGAVNAAVALSRHVERLEYELHQLRQGDPTLDLINANRDAILEKYQKTVRLVCQILFEGFGTVEEAKSGWESMVAILAALNTFHPMHCES